MNETLTTCCDCGRSSPLSAAFGVVHSFKGPQRICPHCQRRRSARTGHRMWALALGLLVGIPLLAVMGYEHDVLWLVMVAAGVLVGMYLSVFPHELGHALMAWAVGYQPLAIVWGDPYASVRREIMGVRLLIGRMPVSGLVFYEPTDARWPRLRRMAITLAGPATNLLIAVGAFQLASLIETPFHESFAKSALLIFGIANAYLGAINLLPTYAVTPVGRFPNDGLKIIKLMMGSRLSLQEERLAACVWRTYFASQDRDPQKILAEADLAEKLSGPAPWIDVARSSAYCQLDRLEEARELLTKLTESNDLDPSVRALAENNLAWALFALDEPAHDAEMLERSARAMELLPWNAAVIGTRATTLAVRASRGSARAIEARDLIGKLEEVSKDAQARSSAAVIRGLLAVADGDPDTARAQLRAAREVLDPGIAGRVLEVRLAKH